MVIFGFAMLVVESIVFFGPPLSSDKAAAVTALFWYFVFAGIAYWLEGKRTPRGVSQENFAASANLRHASEAKPS